MSSEPQQQTRGGRGRGNRNPKPQQHQEQQQHHHQGAAITGNTHNNNHTKHTAAPKHVDPVNSAPPTHANPNHDRREHRAPKTAIAGGGAPTVSYRPHPAPAADSPSASHQPRNQRRRGGRGGNSKKADETEEEGHSAAGAAASFSVSAVPTVTPSGPAASSGNTFESLNLLPELVKATADLGYKAPTPIQLQAIPRVLKGQDILAGAQTGTGKTAAFSLPILQLLTKKYLPDGKVPTAPRGGNPLRVLVLTPTRELAAQVHQNITDLSKYLPKAFFSATVIVGGVGQNQQIAELKKRPTVLVATPGRLLDFHQQGGIVDLSAVEFCVLDEADRMLDMGFYPDVSKILALLPKERQSLLFSATFTPDIRQLAGRILRGPIAEVQVTPPNSTVERIQQSYYLVGRGSKDDALTHIIETNKWSQVLVFVRTKSGANKVAAMLEKRKISSLALHGGKSQTARTSALADFKSGKLRVLVATDIAARGLDIEDLPHVVNYEIPNVPEDYVHRIGRTGRAGKAGYAVSLVSLDEEGFLNNILKFAGKADIPRKTDIPAAFSPAKDEKAEPIAMGQMTLWGGAGPMPPKSVMDAAGREKRKEIQANIRERKEKERAARDAKAARSSGGNNNNTANNTSTNANNNNGGGGGGGARNGGASQQRNGGGSQQQQQQGGRGGGRGGGGGQHQEGSGRGGRGGGRGGPSRGGRN